MAKKQSARKLAKKLGVSNVLVSRKRNQGKTDAQIAAEAKRRAGDPPNPKAGRAESFAEAQLRKESALADLREAEVAKARGELVSVEAASQAWAKTGQAVRDALLSVGERKADEWAALTDPRQVREQIDAEMRQICTKVIPVAIRSTNPAAA